MSHPLTYFCDTKHTLQLIAIYGDELQNLDRSDLLDFVTIFSAACNTDDDTPHSEDTLREYVSDTALEVSAHVDSILEIMDGFDRSNELSLLLGLAAMLADRSAE